MGSGEHQQSKLNWLPYAFPFLLCVSTVTALAAHNPDEGIALEDLIPPLLASLLIATLAWLAACLLTPNRERRSFVAIAIAMPQLVSGYLFQLVPTWLVPGGTEDAAEIIFALLLVVAGVGMAKRSRWIGKPVARFLTWGALFFFFLTFPLNLIVGESTFTPGPLPQPVLGDSISPRPDIFFLVLDAYSGSTSLSRNYGFDNGPFLDSLRIRRFRIPKRLKANYTTTILSLGSMLNRAYLDRLVAASAPRFLDRRAVNRALEFNKTAIDLKAAGYSFIYVGSSYPPLAGNRLAEGGSGRPNVGYLSAVWLSTSLVRAVIGAYCRYTGCGSQGLQFKWETAGDTEAEFAKISSRLTSPGPKFVYAHILLPHPPYRFGPHCEQREPRWPIGQNAVASSADARRYIDQVQCTNRLVLRLVDAIQDASPNAVVLLQADHGMANFPGGVPPQLRSARAAQVRERFDPFAAYAGPGSLADSLAVLTSPVNLFRTVFRVLWHVDEPPLPSRHYWSDPDQPLAPITVSQRQISWESPPESENSK